MNYKIRDGEPITSIWNSTKENTMNPITPEFAAALIKATSQIEGAVKDSVNPHFRSKYADLSAVIEAVKKPLGDNGIMFIQTMGNSPAAATIETILIYKTGEVLSLGTISIEPEKKTPQGMGSAITYARRYALATGLGVPSYDDDGNEASGVKSSHQAPMAPRQSDPMDFFLYYVPEANLAQKEYLTAEGAVHAEYGLWKSKKQLPEPLDKYRYSPEQWSNKLKEIMKAKKEMLAKKVPKRDELVIESVEVKE